VKIVRVRPDRVLAAVNGDGQTSNPLSLSIVGLMVGEVQSSVAQAGGTSSASTVPTTAADPGVTATVQNNGGGPVTVVAATYESEPTGGTTFQVDEGSFVDVQITGADSQDVAAVFFYLLPVHDRGRNQ
jgi:hypothetical protein